MCRIQSFIPRDKCQMDDRIIQLNWSRRQGLAHFFRNLEHLNHIVGASQRGIFTTVFQSSFLAYLDGLNIDLPNSSAKLHRSLNYLVLF